MAALFLEGDKKINFSDILNPNMLTLYGWKSLFFNKLSKQVYPTPKQLFSDPLQT